MQAYKKNVLHITQHLGGGVGRVLLNYFTNAKKESSFIHEVVCLDYANEDAIKIVKDLNMPLFDKMYEKQSELLKMIADADLVLIHWWNHPLLFDFLVRTELPPCKLIMWSHTSGFSPPYVFSNKILNYPDKFVFTTPISFETKEVMDLTETQKNNLRVVWSTGGTEHVKSVKPKEHSGFNVGYIGTVDYAKIHPDFLKICDKINIPNIKFIVCGGSNEKEIKAEAEQLGISEKFEFPGIVEITEYLPIFDVFGYPLAPYHYGTCDQVLAESMAAEIVPIVLDNKMERYMVKDGITGIVAKNENEYIKAIEMLYQDKELREKLSKNAIIYAKEKFSIEKMVKDWDIIFNETLIIDKSSKKWNLDIEQKDITTKDVFMEALGDYSKPFKEYYAAKTNIELEKATQKIKELARSPNWQSKTKGTVHHYNYFFPNDKYIKIWSELMQ